MYQCKADILRLEILWREGGVYIDADMVWLHKDLQDVLDLCKDTGFFCGFEPDTKDKPYSVIGNSFLAATPKHPLVDMLIKYIRAIYPHKRPYHGVEWVTGPLAYTKCISHTKMPWTIPPQIWFYPKFHYVPNPDAINLADFPDSYAFQFGYTCSGLEGWVANSIRRCTLDSYWLDKCPQLKDLDWPLGKLAAFPKEGEAPAGGGEIPKVIHQFAFQGQKPDRWIKTWAEDFVRENPGWSYKCWTSMTELKGDYFCCNMYNDQPWQMDSMAMRLLSLEVIYRHGGYHVPLTSPWRKDCSSMPALDEGSAGLLDPNADGSIFGAEALSHGFAEAESLRIVGCAKESPQCLEKIRRIMMMDTRVINERFLTYPDSVAAYLDFPDWTRFLGASEMWDLCNHPASERAMLAWSYDSTVPCYRLSDGHRGLVKESQQRCIVVTDPELFYFKSLIDSIPGFISKLDQECGSWQVMLIALEYEAGLEGSVLYKLNTATGSPNQKYIGAVFNSGWAKLIPDLDGVKDVQGTFYSSLMQQHDKLRIHVGCEKFTHDRALANIYRSIPSITHAFKVVANHEPPMDFDSQERSGNTLKAFKNGNTRFELQVDNEHRATYRGFNEDGAINSEIRLVDGHAGKRIEWLKVFFNHQVVLEKHNVNV
uniref:Alpha 1,4-glycosyltransferase domain-containing protein n=3 Tax=Hemiselmis andersenii TaxID=464988 RepID=A0A7S1EIP6_HEMAN